MSGFTTHTDDLTITTKTRYGIRDITDHVERVRDAADVFDLTGLVTR